MDNHVYVGSDRDPTDSWYPATPQCGLLYLPESAEVLHEGVSTKALGESQERTLVLYIQAWFGETSFCRFFFGQDVMSFH